jgi:hypothetical protein
MINRPNTQSEVAAICGQPRAIAFISVDWSGSERHSRQVFKDLVEYLTERYPLFDASFWVLHESWEGMSEWLTTCKPPVQAATGHGAVVWMEFGRVIATEEYAVRAGVDGLVQRTLQIWYNAEP